MKKLRWSTDNASYDLDISTPVTLNGVARPVPLDQLRLGVSRGVKLSRPKQIDFMQRFMFMPFIPGYNDVGRNDDGGGVTMQKVVSVPMGEKWKQAPLLKCYAMVQFPHHKLTVEIVWPGLFADNFGNYWDVPLTTQIDLASNSSDSGPSYHLCVHHNNGNAKKLADDQMDPIPPSLLLGLCVKTAFSFKKNVDIWRSKVGKLRMVQPFDIFLSDPHISASGIMGTVLTASHGDNSVRAQRDEHSQGPNGLSFYDPGKKSALLADLFACISCTAQHGNFRRLFLDLTRVYARLDFPFGSTFLVGAAHLAKSLHSSQPTDLDIFQSLCPNVTLSFQQQIVLLTADAA